MVLLLSQKETDLQCLLTKNMIKACKSMVFSTTRSLLKINALDPDCGVTGYTVGLKQALVWATREARLHDTVSSTMIFNIKLDGRPFAGITIISSVFFANFVVEWFMVLYSASIRISKIVKGKVNILCNMSVWTVHGNPNRDIQGRRWKRWSGLTTHILM